MASFTDSISQFNPYVQQIPLEEMAKVGMYKQAQYDQGVQKVQSYIDNVAGLDIMHEADKKYLQSKLGQLGSKLKSVAAGDFSNQQLVSSVGGMASSLIKDKNIQNAVSSTAWYKKQNEELDKAYREGKSSIANVKDFQKQATSWLSKDEAGQTFRGRYSPYIDISKKWNEIIKTVHPNASSEDFVYQNYVDKEGKVNTNQLAAAMTRITKEAVTANQIENAIRSSMTPDDYNQLRIDAANRFDGVDVDGMKGILASGYKTASDQLDVIEKSLKQALTVVAGDPVQLSLTTKSIDELAEQRLKLKKNFETNLALADSNLDGLKTEYYKEGAIGQTAYSFSWEKKAKELLTNPILQADFEQQKINISLASNRETARNNRYSNWIAGENLKIKKEELAIEMDKALGDKYGQGSGFTTMIGKGTDKLNDPVTANREQYDKINGSIVGLKSQIGNGSVAAADLLVAKYQKDVNSVTPRQAEAIKVILEGEKRKRILDSQLSSAKATVLKTDPGLAKRNAEIASALKSNRPITVTVNGKAETFTPKELFDFTSKYESIKLYGLGVGEGPADSKETEVVFSRKEKILNDILNDRTGRKDANIMLNQQINAYGELVKKDSLLTKDLNDAVSKHLATTNGDYVPAVTGIVTESPKARAFYESAAASALSKFSFDKLGIKGGSVMITPDDALKAKKWITGADKDKIQYQKLNYAGEQHLVLTLDGDEVIIPLSADQKLPRLKGEANAFNEDINRIQIGNGNYSTNPTHDVNKSWYQPWDMNTNGLNVYADLERSYTDGGIQTINFALKDKSGMTYPMTLNKSFNASGADEFIRSLNNKDIKDLYLTNPNIPQAWKDKIKNL